ncbi:class I SAM-dependent methyltransferase [Candidatus Chloroploca asiatica]|uniref:Uncharacterized protein n=1 Tax=Candidatus Chloroploca asiatica TaxID=1506545 RepID=A0A2H3L0K6_9CHLR|nr:class I SAM-dependent methyltransferase [Candidatus Chloroploca asiatica]PDV99845.1 hypothetical protein A9Q02_01135 [Candidatus Chloroploca asiatica]
MNILDQYITTAPSAQNAVNIFEHAWSASFIHPYEHLEAGTIPCFTDARVAWAAEKLGGFTNKTILELGPLESAQSYLLEKQGAARIVAIEANTISYLKCLLVKELYNIKGLELLCGDFVSYLKETQDQYDVAFASGVLYHMKRPVELLYLLSQVSDRLFIWTHYYDEALIHPREHLRERFQGSGEAEFAGFKHTLYRQEYQTTLNWEGFCGGSAPFSYWLSRSDIIACLEYFGFDQLEISFETTDDHHGGPSFAIAATRTPNSIRPSSYSATVLEYTIAEHLLAKEAHEPEIIQPEIRQPETENIVSVQIEAMQQLLNEQQTYIIHLEQVVQNKERHIRELKKHVERLENGRIMRLMKALRRNQ